MVFFFGFVLDILVCQIEFDGIVENQVFCCVYCNIGFSVFQCDDYFDFMMQIFGDWWISDVDFFFVINQGIFGFYEEKWWFMFFCLIDCFYFVSMVGIVVIDVKNVVYWEVVIGFKDGK